MLRNKKEIILDEFMPIVKEKLEMGGEVQLRAAGNSMYPLFRHGKDLVTLKKAEKDTLKKYDMILYQRDDKTYVLHRIVGRGKEGYVLRGDNQYVNEYPVREDQIIAKICSFCRNGKKRRCEDFSYRIYAVMWVNSVFLRRVLRAVKNRIKRLGNKGGI